MDELLLPTTFALLVLGLVYSVRKYGALCSHLALYCLVWTAVLVVHVSGYLALNELSVGTRASVLVAVSSFVTGYVVFDRRAVDYEREDLILYKREYSAVASAMLWLGVALVLGALLFVRYTAVAEVTDVGQVRLDRSGAQIGRFKYLYDYLETPGIVFCATVSFALWSRLRGVRGAGGDSVSLRRCAARLGLAGTLAALAGAIIDASTLGRIFLTACLAIFVGSQFPLRRVTGLGSAGSWRGAVLVALAAASFVGLIQRSSVSRGFGSGSETIRPIVLYYAGALSYLDSVISDGDDREYLFGRASLYGMEWVFTKPLTWTGLTRDAAPEPSSVLESRLDFRTIGTAGSAQEYYNAFGTYMLEGYYDYGIVGVGLQSLVFGALCSLSTRRYQHQRAVKVAWQVMLSAWILWSPLAWGFGWGFWCSGPVWLLILSAMLSRKFVRDRHASQAQGWGSLPGPRPVYGEDS